MNYAELMKKKFLGCPMVATMQDTNRERTVKIYYIGETVPVPDPKQKEQGNAHVGVNDGVDVWISPVKGCFHLLHAGYLEQQLVLAAEGKIAPEQLVTIRKTINRPPVKIMQRRDSTHV